MTSNVLLLGFGPFLSYVSNPSGDMAKILNGKTIGDAVVTGKILTVAHKESAMEAHEYIISEKPDVVIGIGLAAARGCISLEKVALNKYYFRGKEEEIEESLYDEGKEAYFSTLPAEGIKHDLEDKGIPTEYSFNPDTYISNEVFYEIMRTAEKLNIPKAGFVHIPLSHTQVATEMMNIPYYTKLVIPSMSNETLESAMKIIVECSVRLWP